MTILSIPVKEEKSKMRKIHKEVLVVVSKVLDNISHSNYNIVLEIFQGAHLRFADRGRKIR